MTRRCRVCKEKVSDRRPVCGSCQRLEAIYANERERQDDHLIARWVGSGKAIPPNAVAVARAKRQRERTERQNRQGASK